MPLKNLPNPTWDQYASTNLFLLTDGFYELPYLSNSGKIMKDSVISLNPAEHNIERQLISCNNDILVGDMFYREIMNGLWLFSTELAVRQNIISKTLYDESQDCDYFFLSFAVFNYHYPVDALKEKFVTLCSMTNTLYKPNTKVVNYFYEGSTGKFFNIAFTREWALQNLELSDDISDRMKAFLNKRTGLINWVDVMPDAVSIAEKLWKSVNSDRKIEKTTQEMFPIIKSVVHYFFNTAMTDSRLDNYNKLQDNDYAKLAAAEQVILSNLSKPFAGVDQIADIVKMSATKLKACFKSIYGFSMLQYHKERNMLLAYQMLQNSDTQIKYVTELVGFTSVSKFSAAFKKRFGILPSFVRKLK